MPEDVLLLGQQVGHGVTGRDVGQKPERVLEIRQQAHVRIRKRRARAGLKVFHRLGRIPAADDVQPLLHVALVFELRQHTRARGLEKGVQIKLVKLPGAGDGHQLVRHLIGEQPHLRQRAIGIPLAGILGGELFFGALLVGVGPVENLFFDELAGGQRLERRAGKIQVSLGGDGQKLGFLFGQNREVFVHVFQAGGVFELRLFFGDRLLFTLEQFLGGLAPCAEVIFVEHDQIPLHLVQPLVIWLDVSGVVAAQQVLKRSEIDQRLLGGDLRRDRCPNCATDIASRRNPREIRDPSATHPPRRA